MYTNQKSSKVMWVIAGVIVLLIIASQVLLPNSLYKKLNSGADKNFESSYQAVFLTNGQVYFGKISKIENDFIAISNVFYLKVLDTLQGTRNPTEAESQPQVSLIKLGNELHGPTDEMYINKEQVLFYEFLRKDSNVVKKIDEYIESQQK